MRLKLTILCLLMMANTRGEDDYVDWMMDLFPVETNEESKKLLLEENREDHQDPEPDTTTDTPTTTTTAPTTTTTTEAGPTPETVQKEDPCEWTVDKPQKQKKARGLGRFGPQPDFVDAQPPKNMACPPPANGPQNCVTASKNWSIAEGAGATVGGWLEVHLDATQKEGSEISLARGGTVIMGKASDTTRYSLEMGRQAYIACVPAWGTADGCVIQVEDRSLWMGELAHLKVSDNSEVLLGGGGHDARILQIGTASLLQVAGDAQVRLASIEMEKNSEVQFASTEGTCHNLAGLLRVGRGAKLDLRHESSLTLSDEYRMDITEGAKIVAFSSVTMEIGLMREKNTTRREDKEDAPPLYNVNILGAVFYDSNEDQDEMKMIRSPKFCSLLCKGTAQCKAWKVEEDSCKMMAEIWKAEGKDGVTAGAKKEEEEFMDREWKELKNKASEFQRVSVGEKAKIKLGSGSSLKVLGGDLVLEKGARLVIGMEKSLKILAWQLKDLVIKYPTLSLRIGEDSTFNVQTEASMYLPAVFETSAHTQVKFEEGSKVSISGSVVLGAKSSLTVKRGAELRVEKTAKASSSLPAYGFKKVSCPSSWVEISETCWDLSEKTLALTETAQREACEGKGRWTEAPDAQLEQIHRLLKEKPTAAPVTSITNSSIAKTTEKAQNGGGEEAKGEKTTPTDPSNSTATMTPAETTTRSAVRKEQTSFCAQSPIQRTSPNRAGEVCRTERVKGVKIETTQSHYKSRTYETVCCKGCSKVPDCLAWTFSEESKKCFLMTSLDFNTTEGQTEWTSGIDTERIESRLVKGGGFRERRPSFALGGGSRFEVERAVTIKENASLWVAGNLTVTVTQKVAVEGIVIMTEDKKCFGIGVQTFGLLDFCDF